MPPDARAAADVPAPSFVASSARADVYDLVAGGTVRGMRDPSLLLALATATAAYVGDGASSRSGALVGARRRRCVVSLAAAPRPKAVVFDLDGCLWYPDMYMLWGGGAPFETVSDNTLLDARKQRVTLLGAVPEILHELKNDAAWTPQVCVASCTDEPSWARARQPSTPYGP